MENKIDTITNLFQGNEIRSIWDAEKEEYYFSVVDVIKSLTDSNNPNDYWYRLKKRMTEEEKIKQDASKTRRTRLPRRECTWTYTSKGKRKFDKVLQSRFLIFSLCWF